ncbi:MAG: hypothetical protein KGK07_16745 [Chloroflexota bacterium]|nr:hypothetical protein [Chloroflexota bacterium]
MPYLPPPLRHLTTPQRRALTQHCRLAQETLNPVFRSQRGVHSIVLTVNSGYE